MVWSKSMTAQWQTTTRFWSCLVQWWILWSCQDITLTVNSKWYRIKIGTFLTLEYNQQELHGIWFQVRIMTHTVRNSIKVLHNPFHDWIISCFRTFCQLARIPGFTWDYLKQVLSTCIHSNQQLKPKSDKKVTPFSLMCCINQVMGSFTYSNMVS